MARAPTSMSRMPRPRNQGQHVCRRRHSSCFGSNGSDVVEIFMMCFERSVALIAPRFAQVRGVDTEGYVSLSRLTEAGRIDRGRELCVRLESLTYPSVSKLRFGIRSD